MGSIVLYAVASIAYAALAVHFWRTRWSATTGTGRAGLAAWERGALLLPIALHGGLLYTTLVLVPQLRFGFAHMLAAMLWLAVLLYWVESLFYSVEGMLAPALLLAAIAAPLPEIYPGRTANLGDQLAFRIHILLAIIAYSLTTIAVLHAALMALVEHRLHNLHANRGASEAGTLLRGPLSGLPPLLTLERLLFRVIAAAFVLLSVALASGMMLSESAFGRALRFNHETVFAMLSWLTFAILLAGRYAWGWRGRTALRWTIAGFALMVLASIGTMFVLEVVLGRS